MTSGENSRADRFPRRSQQKEERRKENEEETEIRSWRGDPIEWKIASFFLCSLYSPIAVEKAEKE